jgi:hypothetical protein
MPLCALRRALAAFQATATRHPGDVPTPLYIERWQEILLHPPPAEWDGVYRDEDEGRSG